MIQRSTHPVRESGKNISNQPFKREREKKIRSKDFYVLYKPAPHPKWRTHHDSEIVSLYWVLRTNNKGKMHHGNKHGMQLE